MIVNIEPHIASDTRLVCARLHLLGWLARLVGVTLVDRTEQFASESDFRALNKCAAEFRSRTP